MKSLEDKTLLLADDEASVREILCAMLKSAGAQVTAVGDGAQALALLADRRFDCAVIDYNMPRIKGDTLADMIKQSHPDMRVVMVSGFAEHLLIGGKLPRFIDVLLSKPCSMEELIEAVGSP